MTAALTSEIRTASAGLMSWEQLLGSVFAFASSVGTT